MHFMRNRMKRLLVTASFVLSALWSAQAQSNTFAVLHPFSADPYGTNSDGTFPYAGLVQLGNTLYGTAEDGGSVGYGTIFAVNTNGAGFTNLHSFKGSDGEDPVAQLVLSGNTLYGTTEDGGSNGYGTVFAIHIDGTGFTNIHNFSNSDGAEPRGNLILSGNTLYGTTEDGGSGGYGTAFAVNTDGTGFATLHSFTNGSDGAYPQGGLIVSGSTLYGTAYIGGPYEYGTLFAVNTDGSGFSVLHSFNYTSGGYPYCRLILSGNTLYGTTYEGGSEDEGTVFAVNTDATGFTNLYVFNDSTYGAYPYAGVILSSNTLYGTTVDGGRRGYGTIFAVKTNGTGITTLYSFTDGTDGASPYGGLILSGKTLYGTALSGSGTGYGTVFSLTLDTGPLITTQPLSQTVQAGSNVTLQVAATDIGPLSYFWLFDGGKIANATTATLTLTNVTMANNGSYEAVVSGPSGSATSAVAVVTVFVQPPVMFNVLHNFSPLTGTTNSEGADPEAGLFLSGNTLYGTTYAGGSADDGIVFSLNTNGSNFTNVYNFTGGSNGYDPETGVILSGNTLYGTTLYGGSAGYGSVYSVMTDGAAFTNLHSFTGYISETYADGIYPESVLVLSGNTLYGVALEGGANDAGTVFKINTNGSGFAVLYSFTGGIGGDYPIGGLVLANNTLYGTTESGGAGEEGTVFSINTDGTGFTILHNFSGGDGEYPESLMVLSSNTLYGTTVYGGVTNEFEDEDDGVGTMFAVNTNGTDFRTLHFFSGGADGEYPYGGLAISGNTLYGTTEIGGTADAGTAFAENTDGTGYTILHYFSYESGGTDPYGGLIISGSTLYGTTLVGGSNDEGTVFSITLEPTGGPVITSEPTNVTVAAGSNATFQVTAIATNALSYYWLFNGNKISGATSDILTLKNVTTANAGNYQVIVSSSTGSTTSTVATLTVVGPPPVVTITSPTNGAAILSNASLAISVTIKPTNIAEVVYYLDGNLLGANSFSPYGLLVPAGSILPGAHALQATAVAAGGVSGYSSVVYFTVNIPGTILIDFDLLNTSAGAVGGTLLSNYLVGYGITLSNVTDGTEMEAANTNSVTGSIQVEVPSAPNFFTQAGLDQPVSFTLDFASPLQSFGFTRVGLVSSTGQVSHPQWTATALNSNGTVLSSVMEGLIIANSLSERSFVLTGNGIASVRFDSDSQQTAAFSAVLLDNLILNSNSVTPPLSVSLSVASPSTNNIVAPATVTLDATVTDLISASYSVSFFAGPTLLGTVSGSPYQITLTNVLAGNYSLQASVTDASGLSALSTVVPITVQLESNSTLVNFDALNTSRAPVSGAGVNSYLAGYGISVTNLSPGTALTVDSQSHIAGGAAVMAASPPNLLTQTGSNGPVQFTLSFAHLLSQFGFTRPELLANPFVSHPAWQATAFNGAGAVVAQVGGVLVNSSTNVGAAQFSMTSQGGPGIASVEFASEGTGLTTFNAMLLDSLILTTNKSAFPPAVAITQPVSGLVLAAPPVVMVTAAASDAAGIAQVSFYANGVLLGTDATSPYAVNWESPTPGNYALTAVASNVLGLITTSAVVNVVIQQSAYQFGIASQPASQTEAVGGSVSFHVVATGTNSATYQWFFNGVAIPGAVANSLVLNPPLQNSNAGIYTVAVTSQGTTLVSSTAVLTVVDAPVITTQPVGTNAPSGSDVSLSVVASGGGPYTYQWLLNANNIPGATNSSYFIEAAQPRQSGKYQVVVGNLAATVLSAPAPVIVETAITIPETNTNFANRASINPLLGPVSDSNQLAGVQAGAPLPDGQPGGNSIWFTWTPTFTGTASLTTQGSDFEAVMAVYTGTQLSSLKAVAADDGSGGYLTSLVTFNVTAGTAYQIAVDGFESASGRVVLGLPAGTGYRILGSAKGNSQPSITKGPVSQVAAAGAQVTLSVQPSSASAFTCQWYFQGAPIAGATGTSFIIKHLHPENVGEYLVLIANAAGSVQSEPAFLQIAANQGPGAVSTGSKFLGSSNSASPRELATVLRPLDTGGDTGGYSVAQVFSTVGATSEPGQPEPCGQAGGGAKWFVYTAPAAGIMQVTTEGSEFNTLLGIYTGPGTSFSNLVEEGCGYTTNYLTQAQPSVVLPNVAKGTVYYILVEGYQGDSGVARLQIGLGAPLVFNALPVKQLVTAGSNATFEVVATGSTPITYLWQLNGANVPGATKSTMTINNAQGAAAGNYTVIVSNVLGAVTSSPPAALTLQYAPGIVAEPTNETVTLGKSAKFSAVAIGVNVKTNPLIYQWYFDDAPVPKATTSTLSIPTTRATNAGTYYLVITNTYGSTNSNPVILIVQSPPERTVAEGGPTERPLSSTPLAGTYSGLFYPAGGATQSSAGFFTATFASQTAGAFSAHLLLDGGSYSFAGQFDSFGNAQSIVPRIGKGPVTASLHLNLDPPGDQMTGVISNADWRSILQAGLASTNAAPECAGPFSFVFPLGTNLPAGCLTITNTPAGTALIAGTLADGARILRTAPIDQRAAIPLYVPLYSGKGLFLGWITLTNSTAAANFGQAVWIKPGCTNLTGAFILK